MVMKTCEFDTFIQLTKRHEYIIMVDNDSVRIMKFDKDKKEYDSEHTYRIEWDKLYEILSYSPKSE